MASRQRDEGLRLAVFGLGYVGVTSTACLAALGHEVIGVDVNPTKVDLIRDGKSPVLEPGVDELLAKHVALGRVSATRSVEEALASADAALVAVGTPSLRTGELDASHVVAVVRQIAQVRARMGRAIPIVMRSTCLPPTHAQLMEEIRAQLPDQPVAYVVHPEFLRAGQAISDFMSPPKIVFGCSEEGVRPICEHLYPGFDMETIWTEPMVAAMVKYADNCFHAVKVTFANEIGMMGKAFGVDARAVMDIVCRDTKLNISPYYLKPGFAFGGSCLPKDLRAMLTWGRRNFVQLPMLENVLPSNQYQVDRIIDVVKSHAPRAVGIFGLAFKDNTDDVRESPMVRVAEQLLGGGCELRIYDPGLSVGRMMGANRAFALQTLPHLSELLVPEPAEVIAAAKVVLVCRSFPEIAWPDLPWGADQLVLDLDGRNDLSGVPVPVDGLHWDGSLGGRSARASKVA